MKTNKINYLSYEDKLNYHIERVMHLKEFGYSFPAHYTVGLVSYCDQFCKGCYAENYRFNTDRHFTASLNALKECLKTSVNFGYKYENDNHLHYSRKTLGLKAISIVGSGEPLLYPHLNEFVLYCKKELNLELGLYTNGNNLKDKHIRKGIDDEPQNIATLILDNFRFIRISLDAATPETHFKERGVKDQFDGIIDNISQLVKRRDRLGQVEPTIGIQFTVDNNNACEILEIAKLAKKLGVDYLAYKPKYSPHSWKDKKITNLLFDDIKTQLLEAQKYENEKFNVHGKFEQFKMAWSFEHNNSGEFYKKCTSVWLSSYLDLAPTNKDKDNADLRLYICVNKDKDEQCDNKYLWSIGPIDENTDFESLYLNKMSEMIKMVDIHDCISGCKNDPLNRILEHYLENDLETISSFKQDIRKAPIDIHVNHI